MAVRANQQFLDLSTTVLCHAIPPPTTNGHPFIRLPNTQAHGIWVSAGKTLKTHARKRILSALLGTLNWEWHELFSFCNYIYSENTWNRWLVFTTVGKSFYGTKEANLAKFSVTSWLIGNRSSRASRLLSQLPNSCWANSSWLSFRPFHRIISDGQYNSGMHSMLFLFKFVSLSN